MKAAKLAVRQRNSLLDTVTLDRFQTDRLLATCFESMSIDFGHANIGISPHFANGSWYRSPLIVRTVSWKLSTPWKRTFDLWKLSKRTHTVWTLFLPKHSIKRFRRAPQTPHSVTTVNTRVGKNEKVSKFMKSDFIEVSISLKASIRNHSGSRNRLREALKRNLKGTQNF